MSDVSFGSSSSADGYTGERMPFSSIPKRWPLVTTVQTRSAEDALVLGKDARLVNCYAELDPSSGDYEVEKRFGYGNPLPFAPNLNLGYGTYNWVGDIYAVFGPAFYKNLVSMSAVAENGAPYRFVQVKGSPAKLVIGNGTNAYYTDGTTLTAIADPDFPSSFCRGWAYLDGTLYVLRPDGGIQGSAIDDPSTWDPVNVIIARSEPDLGVALIKHLTYVVALKQWSTEAFYDAGNPTGSPLARVDGAFIPYGIVDADSLGEIDGTHFWVSSNRTASPQIAKLTNLQLEIVSTPPIERILSRFGMNPMRGYTLKLAGHRLYLLNISDMPFTLVYDIDQKLWYWWQTKEGNFWPFVESTFFLGVHYLQHESDGNLYEVNTDFVFPNDNGTVFPVDIYTPNVDFGIRRSKQLNGMLINADQVPGSTLLLRSSDNDYRSWTNFRKIDLGINQPLITGLGSFFKRACNFRHEANTSFRIKSADLQMDIGTF